MGFNFNNNVRNYSAMRNNAPRNSHKVSRPSHASRKADEASRTPVKSFVQHYQEIVEYQERMRLEQIERSGAERRRIEAGEPSNTARYVIASMLAAGEPLYAVEHLLSERQLKLVVDWLVTSALVGQPLGAHEETLHIHRLLALD